MILNGIEATMLQFDASARGHAIFALDIQALNSMATTRDLDDMLLMNICCWRKQQSCDSRKVLGSLPS